MDFLANLVETAAVAAAHTHSPTLTLTATPTGTISISPPGGTNTKHHDGHHHHLPLPTDTFPSAVSRYIHASHVGHSALWVFVALFAFATVGVLFLTLRAEKRSRLFHGVSSLILTISTLSYFASASHLGITFVPIHNHGAQGSLVHLFRELFYARYIDWLFTTPLLIFSLASLAGLSPATTLQVVITDILLIVSSAFAALVPSRWAAGERAQWGWFGVSGLAFIALWLTLFTSGSKAASYRPRSVKGLFFLASAGTFLAFAGYPIIFGLTHGGNKISVDAEIIAYGVLDVIAKIGIPYALVFLHSSDETGPWTLPDWWVEHPQGYGPDGQGVYGSLGTRDE